jgi:hypothetical protein
MVGGGGFNNIFMFRIIPYLSMKDLVERYYRGSIEYSRKASFAVFLSLSQIQDLGACWEGYIFDLLWYIEADGKDQGSQGLRTTWEENDLSKTQAVVLEGY